MSDCPKSKTSIAFDEWWATTAAGSEMVGIARLAWTEGAGWYSLQVADHEGFICAPPSLPRPDIENLSKEQPRRASGAPEYDRPSFEMWHPQWGGYGFPCVVSFDAPGGANSDHGLPCFDVVEWHDGEFTKDEPQYERHYCSPLQVLGFAVTIMECMVREGHALQDYEVEMVRRETGRLCEAFLGGDAPDGSPLAAAREGCKRLRDERDRALAKAREVDDLRVQLAEARALARLP